MIVGKPHARRRRRLRAPAAAIIFAWLLLAACAVPSRQTTPESQPALPRPQGFFTDLAEKLSPETKTKLEGTLKEFADVSGVDLAVVILSLDLLQGATFEDYSLRLGREWRIGRGPDKLGLLFLIAIKPADDNGVYTGETRLEVSRNLEGDIPNDLAQQIIRKARGDLRLGRFDQAVTDTVADIITTLTAKRGVPKSR